MELIPAIDVLDGKAVRLRKGRYDEVTVYADDPLEPARRFHAAGARSLHVVDLDGAREGRPENLAVIRRILEAIPLDVSVGGGIRDRETAGRWLDLGARVVMGTAAIKDPALTQSLCEAWPGRVVVALDARDGEVSVEGWTEGTGRIVAEVAREAQRWGAGALLYTNIERDGTRDGPDVAGTAALQRDLSVTVIASGGIGRLEDLRALAASGVRAAVCGRALYAGAFTLEEALAVSGEG